MADLFGELTGNIKKAIEVIDRRQKALVEEIKKDGAAIMDKAAETTETVIENIDTHIEELKGTAENPDDSIEQLEKFLDTLKDDIKNLTGIVEQRAKEIQLAVKKNTELILQEVGEDLQQVHDMITKELPGIQDEKDDEKKRNVLNGLLEHLNEVADEMSERMEDLRESGAEASRKAVEEAHKQVMHLTKAVNDLLEDLPVKATVTPAGGSKPVKKAKKAAKPKE